MVSWNGKSFLTLKLVFIDLFTSFRIVNSQRAFSSLDLKKMQMTNPAKLRNRQKFPEILTYLLNF
jgi:hypothetical protein